MVKLQKSITIDEELYMLCRKYFPASGFSAIVSFCLTEYFRHIGVFDHED